MKNNTIRIIVVLTCIIGSFFLGWKCALRKSIINTTPQTIVETVVQYDTSKIESVIYTPIPYKEIEYVNQTDTIFLLQDVDTLEILHEFITTYYYADTIKNDTSAFIAIYDEVLYNRIWRRNWEFVNRRPTHIQSITNIYPKRWNLGVGAIIGGNGNSTEFQYGLGANLSVNRTVFTVNYIVPDKSVQCGVYYNLFK